MAKLGSAQTDNFLIGTAELRLGTLADAGKLSQVNSVGLVDNVTATISQKSVDLMGGFPQVTVKTAITEQSGKITAVLKEYSRRNLNIMLGNGIPAAVTDAASTVASNILIGATTFDLVSGTGFADGDVVVIYQEGKPESVSVVKLLTVVTNTVTIAANSLAQAYNVASGVIHVAKANPVALGNITKVNEFSASIVMIDADGKPTGFNIWKAAISGDFVQQSNAQNFATSNIEIKILQPTIADTDTGGPLESVAALVADHPMGLRF